MAEQALIQFRVDKDLKQEVADICDDHGRTGVDPISCG